MNFVSENCEPQKILKVLFGQGIRLNFEDREQGYYQLSIDGFSFELRVEGQKLIFQKGERVFCRFNMENYLENSNFTLSLSHYSLCFDGKLLFTLEEFLSWLKVVKKETRLERAHSQNIKDGTTEIEKLVQKYREYTNGMFGC